MTKTNPEKPGGESPSKEMTLGAIKHRTMELAAQSNPRIGSRGFQVESLADAMRVALTYCEGGMSKFDSIPKLVVAMEHGMSLGLTASQSVQSIAVINGQPVIYGDAGLALVKQSGMLRYISESVEGSEETGDWRAICTVKRASKREDGSWGEVEHEHTEVFSMLDAKSAGLWAKAGPWRQYPKRMMQMRARSFAIRNVFPDVLKGVSIREEVEDYQHTRQVENTAPREINGSRAAGLGAELSGRVGKSQDEPTDEQEGPSEPEYEPIDTEATEIPDEPQDAADDGFVDSLDLPDPDTL